MCLRCARFDPGADGPLAIPETDSHADTRAATDGNTSPNPYAGTDDDPNTLAYGDGSPQSIQTRARGRRHGLDVAFPGYYRVGLVP